MNRLNDLLAPDDATLDRLHIRLEAAAAVDGALDVAYRTIDTPLGSLLLAATPVGVVRVAFDGEDHAGVLETLATRISPRVLRASSRLDSVARQVDEYFEGKRRSFDVPVDFQLSKGFRREVLTRLLAIGYGTTTSYAGLAAAAGNPGAVRAVGTACATNPIPLIVPCHRVIQSNGSIGQYAGGVEAKRLLLMLEGSVQETPQLRLV